MSFFNFVKQNYTIWTTTNCFCKLSTFIVANISRRSTDKSTYGKFFHVLTHINSSKRFFIIEKEVCQSFCKFSFTNPSRSDKQETPQRFIFIRKPCPISTDCISNRLNSLILPNNSFVQNIFKFNVFLHFTCHHFANWNSCPSRNNSSNIFFANFFSQKIFVF